MTTLRGPTARRVHALEDQLHLPDPSALEPRLHPSMLDDLPDAATDQVPPSTGSTLIATAERKLR